jgi:hypothetical protein
VKEYGQATLLALIRSKVEGGSTSPRHSSSRLPSTLRSISSSRWLKPDAETCKANSDADLSVHGIWGLGAIFKNDEGLVMLAATWSLAGCQDPVMAEVYGFLLTM